MKSFYRFYFFENKKLIKATNSISLSPYKLFFKENYRETYFVPNS